MGFNYSQAIADGYTNGAGDTHALVRFSVLGRGLLRDF